MLEHLITINLEKGFIPISRFNKGQAGQIIEEVKKEGIKVILKNNVPQGVLLPYTDEYLELLHMANLI
ncbi:MAG: hypothetical protein J6X54_09250 [Treponema sp.]|nr:hypothetical protein [Treponema sp.]